MADSKSFRKTLVIGAHGQVGSALAQLLDPGQSVFLSRKELDLAKPATIAPTLSVIQPDCVINAGAYTQVDLAEKEEKLAHTINAEAPAEMALWCKRKGVPFVHYSTDYVFNGEGTKPWRELDPVAPLNAYGRTKAAGEKKIQKIGGDFMIFRTSWVYHHQGKNFLRTMLKFLQEREQLRIVSDQKGAPTSAAQLAHATLEALRRIQSMPKFPTGIYHLCAGGEASWFDFTVKIREIAEKRILLKTREIVPIQTSEYPTPALRPLNSRLDTSLLKSNFGISLPDWETGLSECMEKITFENTTP